MPFRRKARIRLYQTTNPVKHSDTAILTSGSASAPTETIILNLDAGARTLTGATQNIQANATTDNTCMVGSTVKYVNIRIQTAARPTESGADDRRIGWYEYALVMVKETEAPMLITNIGTTTVADMGTKMYRNECIWTGAIPCSDSVPNTVDLKIKVPKFKQKLKLGDEWRLYTYYRDVLATGTGTTQLRAIITTQFISYD